jgi:hypothetical protein
MAKTQNEERGTAATLEGAAPTGDAKPSNPPPPSVRPGPRLGVGLPVHVSDHADGKVHAAVVTHVNDDDSSIVATVFKPNETLVGVGFKRSELGLATPGCWHWPNWMTGE